MKKSITKIMAVILSILFVFQVSFCAYAQDEPEWEDIEFTQEEFDEITALNPGNEVMPYATGLIVDKHIALTYKGTSLIIAGDTMCYSSVKRCGFSYLKIKERANKSLSWTTFMTYTDLCSDTSYYRLSKTVPVKQGYQYQVECTHYAKKSVLSVEKINNTSNLIIIA